MAYLNLQEKINMIFIYGEAGNSAEASRLYAERFPEERHPSRRSFDRIVKLFREKGSVLQPPRKRMRVATDEATQIGVLGTIMNNPNMSCRQVERYHGVSKSSVHRILQLHKFHPFHISLHQELHDNDFQTRMIFCEWAMQQIQVNDNFFYNVLFTDESTFTNHGQLNTHNMHYWSVDNPHWLRQVVHQRPWSVNVWCGILADQIIGPFFINGTLNGNKYANFLNEDLPRLMEEVTLAQRMEMWYQHDGCPAHNSRIAREILDKKFPQRWIGRGANVLWPPRSPDLTPLDFFLWGTLKNIVYEHVPTTPEDMKNRITTACSNISSEMIRRARESFIFRVQKCIENNGHHFEHLLK